MKIKDTISLVELEKFGYRYQENLLFPTYRKVIQRGRSKIVIEILVMDRTVFINRNKNITKKGLYFFKDLITSKFLE